MSPAHARTAARNTSANNATQQRAANDAVELAHDAPASPLIVLTPAMRTRCFERALAVDPAAVKLPLSYLKERLAWLARVYAMAWSDHAAIAAIDLGDRSVSVREIEEFGEGVEYTRDLVAGGMVSSILDGIKGVTKLSDAQLRRAMSGERTKLCGALAARFSGDAEVVDQIRAIRNNRLADAHGACNLALFLLFANDTLVAWLRVLPKGEGAALDRLHALHVEWTRRENPSPLAVPAGTPPDDLLARSFTATTSALARILNVGRYLIGGRPERKGHYRGFQPPKAKGHAAKKSSVATQPADAAPKPPTT